ncbi:hypothetical protein INT47_005318, partial [Mucor saturninus]
MCDVNDPRILNAYIAITEEEPTDWLLLGYKDTRSVISLYASGTNGLSEFREHITNEILFGFVRVDDRFILITYVPDSVSGVRRARALVHSRSVASILELSHAQFTASSLSDMSDANIRTRLKLGQNQVPNRPRPTSMNSKRASTVTRRRKSNQYSPSPSPSPMSERNLRILTTDEPFSYDDDRMTATPTPSSPTSVASSFAESSISTLVDHLDLDDKNKDATEAMLQLQLAKKKELEEARFRQFQRDQQEERFKRDQAIKKFEQEEKQKQQLQQQKPAFLLKKELTTKKTFTFPKAEEKKSGIFPQVVLRKVTPGVNNYNKDEVKKDVRSVLSSYKKIEPKQELKTEIKVELKKVHQEVKSAVKDEVKAVIKKQTRSIAKEEVTPIKEVSSIKEIVPIKESVPNKESASVKEEVIIREQPQMVVKEQDTKAVLEVKQNTIETQPEAKTDIKAEVQPAVVRSEAIPKVQQFWRRRHFVIEDKRVSFYKDEMAKVPISEINLLTVTRLAPANEDEDTYVPNSFVIDTQTGDSYQIFADDKRIVKQMYAIIQSS